MVMGDIGDNPGVEGAALHPVLVDRVGGDLHHRVAAALRHHQGQHALQVVGIGGGVPGGQHPLPNHILDGADQPHFLAVRLEDAFEQIGGSRLAVCPRHADHPQALRGIPEPVGAHPGPGPASRRHQHLRDAVRDPQLHRMLGHDDGGAVFHRLPDILMAVHSGPADADKSETRLDAA